MPLAVVEREVWVTLEQPHEEMDLQFSEGFQGLGFAADGRSFVAFRESGGRYEVVLYDAESPDAVPRALTTIDHQPAFTDDGRGLWTSLESGQRRLFPDLAHPDTAVTAAGLFGASERFAYGVVELSPALRPRFRGHRHHRSSVPRLERWLGHPRPCEVR